MDLLLDIRKWNLIEPAAVRHGIPADELVRAGAVAEDRIDASLPATLSKGHAGLIEAIYRSVYVMVTLKREELLDADRDTELRPRRRGPQDDERDYGRGTGLNGVVSGSLHKGMRKRG